MIPFSITRDDIPRIQISKEALPITHFCEVISESICHDNMKKLSRKPIINWLIENEYLLEEEVGGVKRKRAGKKASQIGIYEEKRTGYKGEYLVVLYSEDAQRYIINNLINILESGKYE